MKKLFLSFALASAFAFSLYSQPSGYFVCTTTPADGFKTHKCQTLTEATAILDTVFKGNNINLEHELKRSIYYDVINQHSEFYIERKHIKITKKGTVKFKRIKL